MRPTTRRIAQISSVGAGLFAAVGFMIFLALNGVDIVPLDDGGTFQLIVIGAILAGAGLFNMSVAVAFWLEATGDSPQSSRGIPPLRLRRCWTSATTSARNDEVARLRRRAEKLVTQSRPSKPEVLLVTGQVLLTTGLFLSVPTSLFYVRPLFGIAAGVAIGVVVSLLIAVNVLVYQRIWHRVRNAEAFLQRTAQPNPAP